MTFMEQTPVGSPGFLIWQVHNLWQKRIRAMLKPLGITHVQFILIAGMVWLTLEDEEITQAKLAKLTNTDVMMASVVLRKLEEKGYINRMQHPDDPRAMKLTLTLKGVILSQKAIAEVDAFDQSFFGDFDRKDKKSFMEDLLVLLRQEEMAA